MAVEWAWSSAPAIDDPDKGWRRKPLDSESLSHCSGSMDSVVGMNNEEEKFVTVGFWLRESGKDGGSGDEGM